ncbi:YfhO family protein [Staphylococcus sp. HKU1]|uniref:YfhO family protein n=1 Tax=Staphylococcus sp. HKU1 TaxID=3068989 RepID=UPI003AAA6615
MNRNKLYIFLFLFLAIIGHGYIIYRFFHDGVLFTGPNDGMEQMVPIQKYLYNQWSHGNWFYSTDFGLGGDFFTDLSYYFTTNILFIINVIIIAFLKIFIPLDTSSMMFWMTNALIVSVIKSAIAMYATYLYVNYITHNKKISLFTAFIFVVSPLYFRFTVYWPFFSDIFILLPLLLWSIERYLKNGKIGWFIVISALSLVNNFYFAYYQLLTGLIYLIVRLVFKHKDDILPRLKALKTITIAAILALICSLFTFSHGIQSFLNNRRVPFRGHVDMFEKFNQNTDIFYDNYLIVILFVTVQALLAFKLYKHYYFRLFAVLTIISIIASFVPFVDQLFNGLSAPQKRWHYLLAFNSAMLIGLYVKHFRSVSIVNYVVTSILGLAIIFISAWRFDNYVAWLWFAPVVTLVGLLVLLVNHKNERKKLSYFYAIAIMILTVFVSIVFTRNQIFFQDHVERASKFYTNASKYSTPLQRQLVSEMKHDKNEDERIDWRVNEQDNTPMYQNFKGLSLYSSIFDHNILDFYYDAMKINLKNESLSRYQTTNGRQNIASLFSVRYLMLKEYQHNVPEHFKQIKSSGQYRVFENTLNLPAVSVTNNVYNAQSIHSAIDREHAMMDGVIMENQGKKYDDQSPNLFRESKTTYEDMKKISHDKYQLSKAEDRFKIHISKDVRKRYEDYYVTMKINRGQPDSNYTVNVNGYLNSRLFNNSTYRTGVDTQLYRTKPDKNGNIYIELSPKGTFDVKFLRLDGENYKKLKQAKQKRTQGHHYHDIKNGVKVNLKEHNKGTAVVNIPYREGMVAYVDGRKVSPKKVNYMMTGVPVSSKDKEIIIKYRPKLWYTMLIVSIIGIVVSVIWVRRRKD